MRFSRRWASSQTSRLANEVALTCMRAYSPGCRGRNGAPKPAENVARGTKAVWQGEVPQGLPREGDALEVLAETLRLLGTDARASVGPDLPHLVSGLAGFLGWPVVRVPSIWTQPSS